MLFPRINLRKELLKEQAAQRQILDKTHEWFAASEKKEKEILLRLKKQAVHDSGLAIDETERENTFSLEAIRQVCIRYRLRFLDTTHFRSQFPYSALSAIKAFEEKNNVTIESFKIIAPAEAFKLENINKDPLLFARLSDNNYYLLHQWGHELSFSRRILAWPVQNFRNLLITLFAICLLFSFSLPSSIMYIFSLQSEIYLRIWLSVHTFIGLLGLTLWAGLSFDKSFSSMSWNSKYFNY